MAATLLKGLTLEKWQLIQQAACKLDVPALHLAAVICFETGESFSPLAENPFSGAIGLIQFTKVGVLSIPEFTNNQGWKAVKTRLKGMTFEQQLFGPVIDYFRANRAVGLQGLADLYMCVLAPAAVNKPLDYVLYRSPKSSYNQNRGLDDEKKGYITKADAAQEVLKKLEKVKARVKKLEAL
jgi:hypothetical protein